MRSKTTTNASVFAAIRTQLRSAGAAKGARLAFAPVACIAPQSAALTGLGAVYPTASYAGWKAAPWKWRRAKPSLAITALALAAGADTAPNTTPAGTQRLLVALYGAVVGGFATTTPALRSDPNGAGQHKLFAATLAGFKHPVLDGGQASHFYGEQQVQILWGHLVGEAALGHCLGEHQVRLLWGHLVVDAALHGAKGRVDFV